MSSSYESPVLNLGNGYIHGRNKFTAEERVPHYEKAGDKTLKRILGLVVVLLAAELVWFFGISPCMPLKKIEIRGIPGIDEGAVLALAGIGAHSSYMTVNAPAAESALLVIPAVRSARVIKHFPGSLEIILEQRRAAAIALVQDGRRLTPAMIGGDGMVFSVGAYREDELLPLVSGISFDGAFAGMKLPRVYQALFAQLEKLSLEAPELLGAISEIKINQKNYDGFDLTVYPANAGVRVRIGQEINEETIRYMLLMLDVVSSKPGFIDEIDFRTGTASYTVKEAYSG
ncbi:MAG: FtsQ-type POTRA domain-containing protein [Treponema sp.]|jgi:cell division protein FtsQ|nr:FtsQ-type POTRA domain-containing protein [Treponema sp.]